MTSETRTLHACIRSARRRLYAARGLESLLIGVFGAELTLAALALAGERILGAPAISASLLGGVFCGGSFLIEHRRSREQVASALDSALARGGSLFTAFECEATGARGGLPGRLVRRERERLSPRDQRAILPRPVTFAFAPVLGAFVLAASIETASIENGGAIPPASRAPAATSPGAAFGESEWTELERSLDTLEVAALDAFDAARATEVDPAESPAGPLTEADVVRGLAELERAMREAEVRGSGGSRLDALRSRTASLRDWADRRTRASELAGAGAESSRGPGGSGENRGSNVEPGPEARGEESTSKAEASPESGPDAGRASGRWWSADLDPVVEGWVEARRAALRDSVR